MFVHLCSRSILPPLVLYHFYLELIHDLFHPVHVIKFLKYSRHHPHQRWIQFRKRSLKSNISEIFFLMFVPLCSYSIPLPFALDHFYLEPIRGLLHVVDAMNFLKYSPFHHYQRWIQVVKSNISEIYLLCLEESSLPLHRLLSSVMIFLKYLPRSHQHQTWLLKGAIHEMDRLFGP